MFVLIGILGRDLIVCVFKLWNSVKFMIKYGFWNVYFEEVVRLNGCGGYNMEYMRFGVILMDVFLESSDWCYY